MKNFISVKEMNEKVNEMFNGAILKYESNEHKGTYVTAGSKFIAVGTNDGDIKTFKTWEDAAAYANSLDSAVMVGIRRARHSKYTEIATVNCEVAEQEETVALNTEVADEIIRNLYDSVADAYGSMLVDGEEYNIKSFADFLYSYAHCGEVPGIDDYIEAIGVEYEWEDYLRVEEMFSNRIDEKFLEYLNEDKEKEDAFRGNLSDDFVEEIQENVEDIMNGCVDEYTLGDEWFFEMKSDGEYLTVKDLFSVYQKTIYLPGAENVADDVIRWVNERVGERKSGLVFYELLWGNEESGDMDLMGPELKHIFFDQETAMNYAKQYAEGGEVMVCENYWIGYGETYRQITNYFVKSVVAA